MQDLIKIPKDGNYKDYKDSGEGGLAVFFVLLSSEAKPRRQKCIAGQGAWTVQNVVVGPRKYIKLNDTLSQEKYGQYTAVDLVMLVASTNESLWSEKEGRYWQAREEDLTGQGRTLSTMLTKIFGQKPDIVTLLDT